MAVKEALANLFNRSAKSDKGQFDFKSLKTTVDKIFAHPDNVKIRETQTRFMKRFKGDWWDVTKLRESDSTIQANLFFSTVMTIAPLITDNRPIWGVRARKAYLQNHMEGFSLALEYLWDKLDMDAKSFLWILDALIMKIGILKCYYDPNAEFGGEVAVELVDPRTFFCAPGYDDIWKSPMCGTKTPMPLSWVRMTYPETGANVKPDATDEVFTGGEKQWELDTKFVTVYEVWFKDGEMEDYFVKEGGGVVEKGTEGAEKKSKQKYPYGRVVTFTADALLDDKPSMYRHSKPPYVALYDYQIPHELVGMGEGDQIEEMNKSFNRNLQLIDNWTKDYCDAPWLIDTNANLDFEKTKAELLAGHSAFEVNMSISPEPIKKAKSPPLDQAVPLLMSMLQKLHEEITGVTDVTKGMVAKSQRQSATEISTLAESAYTRTRQRVRNYEWSVKRLLYLKISLMQQFYTEPRDFSLTSDNTVNYYTVGSSNAQAQQSLGNIGPEGPVPSENPEEDARVQADYEKFIAEWGAEDPIYSGFDLEVQTNSSLPMDKQSLANLYLRLLEMAGGNPVTGMPMWEAVLAALRIPRYKEIIGKMEEMFKAQTQPPQGAGQAPEVTGEPGLMQVLQRAGGQ